MTTDRDGLAFPTPFAAHDGMTLRDYAAIAAMQGMLAALPLHISEAQQERLAKTSYSMADEMLKAKGMI